MSKLSHRDSTAREYCHGCFPGLGTDEPSANYGPPWAPSPNFFGLIRDAS
jgi:hypothetical protein